MPPSRGHPLAQGATMTVSLAKLMALIVAFGAEVGWLCRC
jgi:hypothetical protein